jgi:hypothetical protein
LTENDSRFEKRSENVEQKVAAQQNPKEEEGF